MKSVLCILFMGMCSYTFSQSKILILGIAQDGGFPHIGCQKQCQRAWEDPTLKRFVVSLAVLDEKEKKWWMFESTPNFVEQLQYFQQLTKGDFPYLPEGIFLTHAHIGHYSGLMQLGREALGAKMVKVHTLPKMGHFLKQNGPWSQLVELGNIDIRQLVENDTLTLTEDFKLIPYAVPHRDEFSETAGYHIIASDKKALFIPDINKWEKWDRDIIEEVGNVDRAFLDGSFFQQGEIQNRSMSEIPHPFVVETMSLFENEPRLVKSNIYFIHFNHTNPLLWDANARMKVISAGFNFAIQGKFYD